MKTKKRVKVKQVPAGEYVRFGRSVGVVRLVVHPDGSGSIFYEKTKHWDNYDRKAVVNAFNESDWSLKSTD